MDLELAQEYVQILKGELSVIDPEIDRLIRYEEEKQARKIILIPSESIAPEPVLKALGSVFNNIYAEGYPPLRMTREEIELVMDFAHQLSYYRRYGDRRFYKGVEYAHFVETLAQRRVAQAFANEKVPAERIYVNVQPLSGAPANISVYDALLNPGDTIMGMDLFQGGHLTHGSEFNISGRRYKVVSYGVDPVTERLNYDQIMKLALEYKPRLIVAGYTSYSWAPDWEKFREIADAVGAYLMADIAHTAGLVVAGAHPSPIGIADVITFTTHKTIFGPRGAVIITTDEELAQRIDAAVFPGIQGGPHVNKFAAIAVAFKIAQTEPFKRIQHKIVKNAKALAEAFQKRGIKVAYGGTDTHLVVLDLRSIKTDTGYPVKGEIAARLLDIAGIIVNKNTIPGDTMTPLASGIRLGTPWVTQRGLDPEEMDEIADIMTEVLVNIKPFRYYGRDHELPRGKIELEILKRAACRVDELIERIPICPPPCKTGYPHYCFLPGQEPIRKPLFEEKAMPEGKGPFAFDLTNLGLLMVRGWRAEAFIQQVNTANLVDLKPGMVARSFLLDADGKLMDDISILRFPDDPRGRQQYLVVTNPENTERVKEWFRALSDGYIIFDRHDLLAKIEGPVIVDDLWEDMEDPMRKVAIGVAGEEALPRLRQILPSLPEIPLSRFWTGQVDGAEITVARVDFGQGHELTMLISSPDGVTKLWKNLIQNGFQAASPQSYKLWRTEADWPSYDGERPDALTLYRSNHKNLFALSKPYFVGERFLDQERPAVQKEEFRWEEKPGPLKHTPLYEEHKKLKAKLIPFAGWEMPVWYTSVLEEHRAVREAAGLFDVAHMGVFEISGDNATSFLDFVTTNYVRWLEDGQSLYSYLLDPDGNVIDDVMIYRLRKDRYIMVVNAANEEKDWAWLNAVNSRRVIVDREHPDKEVDGQAILRNLKDPSSGKDMKVDIALQGPASIHILMALADRDGREILKRLRRTELAELTLDGMDVIVARTGYTGEEWGYEIFVHPEDAPRLWNLLLEKGKPFGIKPAGLGARDSTRTEAGLPLYGHELAGPFNIDPIEAGFGPYVKFHKPYFIGRKAIIEKEAKRTREIIRFRMNRKGVPRPEPGDRVINQRGDYIGVVTSCAIDTEGYLTGMALVDRRYAQEGAQIGIFAGRFRQKEIKPIDKLGPGDSVPLPEWATILPRFMRRS